jgi:uncharacterized glyoxalase superfamily protein PhnB
MLPNRSMPEATVIPVLGYPDVNSAVSWLCDVFGFTERLRIGDHRAQLLVGTGAVVVAQRGAAEASDVSGGHSIMVRIADADAHFARAHAGGARILQPPTDFPYGERQCSVQDIGGHIWTFSQSIRDVDPADWGGILLYAAP